jgi:hypothetical protein
LALVLVLALPDPEPVVRGREGGAVWADAIIGCWPARPNCAGPEPNLLYLGYNTGYEVVRCKTGSSFEYRNVRTLYFVSVYVR